MLYIDITRLYNNARLLKMATGVDKVNIAYIRQYGEQCCAVIRLPSHWLFLPYQRSQLFFNKIIRNQSISLSYFDKKLYKKPSNDLINYLLNISHNGLESPLYLQRMTQYKLRGIYFLHDIIPIDYPEYCRQGEYQKHLQRLITMLSGDLIIANSQYTVDRFRSFCQKHNYQLPTTIWAHLGTEDNKQNVTIDLQKGSILKLLIDNTPYFVILGTIEARKNHLFLLNLWRELKQELGTQCPKLVIIGKRGWEIEQVVDILERSSELKGYIIELNYCRDDEVNYLVQNSQALLFPSFVEGFGLPLIQAFQQKVPVIANNIAVFKELNFGEAPLISVIDGISWKQAIIDYSDSKNIKRMCQISIIEKNYEMLPTWEKHFANINPYISRYLSLSKL